MDKVQSIQNQSQIPKNGQASGKFSNSGPSNPQNSDRLWADFGPSNPQNRGQPYIGASGGLVEEVSVKRLWSDPGPIPGQAKRGPGKLLYMAVHDIGDLRAQNQPQVCLNFGDFRVQGRKIRPKVVRFGGFETDLGCFGPGPWTQII